MNKWNQEISKQASKKAVDMVRKQKNGIAAYHMAGIIFSVCGIGWMLLSLIPIFSHQSLNEYSWMLILGIIQIILGIIILVLNKKSKRFQAWANKDFRKGLEQEAKFKQKVQFKNKTLPLTYGDLFALKFLAILSIILILVVIIF